MPTSNPQQLLQGLQLFQQAQQLHAAQQLPQAAEAFRRALLLMPDHPNVLAAFAKLAEDMQDWPVAEKLYRHLGQLRPEANVEPRLANALSKQKYHAAAATLLEHCLARDDTDPTLSYDLARCLCKLGRWEEGLSLAERALAQREEARFLFLVLAALYQLGRAQELDRRVDNALRRFPNNRAIRAIFSAHHLRAGTRLVDAFTFFPDMRWSDTSQQSAHDSGTAGALWDGIPFNGTLRVFADAGLGDQILAASMFPDLVMTGQHTQVLCDARLIPIFRRSFPALTFCAANIAGQATALSSFNANTDCCINGIDAGRFFRRDANAFPIPHQWLSANSDRAASIRSAYAARWPGKRLIGLSWKSARLMEDGASKSIALGDMPVLLTNPDHLFVSLQYGNITADIASLGETASRLFVDPEINATNDIDALFAQVAALDLVITTSSTTAHVAGSLGVPCWVLLPRSRPVLWYWGYEGDSSPWYPSIRLIRNSSEGDWRTFLAGVATQLDALPTARPIG